MLKESKLIIAFFIIVFLYFNQESICGAGTFLGRLLLLFIIIICVFYMIKCVLLHRIDGTIKYVLYFLTMNIIWYVWQLAFIRTVQNEITINILKSTILATISIFPFYYWGRKNFNLTILFQLFLLIHLCGLIYGFFYDPQIIESNDTDNSNIVLNIGYSFVAILPFAYLFKSRHWVSIIFVLITTTFIINSAKRGAIVCAGVFFAVFIYYIFHHSNNTSSKMSKYIIYIIMFAGVLWMLNAFQNNEYVVSRFIAVEDGNSSGRDVIYKNIWETWSAQSNTNQLLFGYGYCASLLLSGTQHFAHNDWLELLAGFGIFGVAMYLITLRSMIKPIFEKGRPYLSKYLILSIMIIWFVQTLFSMSYLSENNFLLSMLLGYAIGTDSKYKEYDKR